MERWREHLPFTIAAVLSLALHLFVLFPALGLMGSKGLWWSDAVREASLEHAEDDLAPTDTAGGEKDAQAARDASQERHRNERAAASARRALQERRNRDRALPREEQEEVRLGIDESTAVTMNWIGYDEYQEHLAELAEVEQAAYRLAEASGSNGTADASAAPAPPTPSVAVSPNPSPLPLPAAAGTAPTGGIASAQGGAVDPTAAQAATPPSDDASSTGSDPLKTRPPAAPPATESAATRAAEPVGATPSEPAPLVPDSPDPALPDASGPTGADGSPLPQPSEPKPLNDPTEEPRTEPGPEPVDPVAPTRQDPTTPGVVPESQPREITEPTPDPTERASSTPVPTSTPPLPESSRPDTPAPARAESETPSEIGTAANAQQGGGVRGEQPVDGAASTPAQQSPRGKQSDNPAASGEVSDRESDATSIVRVDVTHWRNGKPLAAKGLVLKPARPRFTTLNYVDGIGRNPVAELQFGRDGVPQVARLIGSTGNPGVDDSIRAALFKWRASGAQLEKLKPGQTVTIQLRLIMLAD